MKVLWFINSPLPALSIRLGQKPSLGGGWLSSAAALLRVQEGVELAIATATPDAPNMQFTSEGILYYTIAQAARTHFLRHSKANLRRASDIVADCRPDLIHVHGTERFYGLILGMGVEVPVIVSIQGLISRTRKVLFAGLTFRERIRAIRVRDVLRWTGPLAEYFFWRSGSTRELEIISKNRYFIGRTEWDRAWVHAINPNARYYVCDEVIRPVFFEGCWSLPNIKRHSMLFTSAMQPGKGIPQLLDAAWILRRKYPDLRLQLAGDWYPRSGWGRVIRHRLRTLGLDECVTFSGPVDAETLASHLKNVHAFVSSSWLENSSNSVAEAMLMGTPCVVPFTGGMTTIVSPGETGLMYPPGDPALLAAAVGRVFDDDALAVRLSYAAKRVALRRHDPRRNVARQLEIYQEVIANHAHTTNQHLAGPSAVLC
jgi:glycosyltransferase involved in cell wall biosynthesis